MDDKERKETSRVRPISKAPKPITPLVGGTFLRPKHTQIPPGHPPYYPNHLIPQTDAIIAEAVGKFQDQKHALALCKYVFSELTPFFVREIRSKRLRADLALSSIGDQLHSLLIYNCDNENERFLLDQEARKSDEWLKLARQIAEVAEEQLDDKSKEVLEAPVSLLDQDASHAGAGDPGAANTSLLAQIEDAERDTGLWLQTESSAEERTYVFAMQGRLADLYRIQTHRIEGRSLPDEEGKWAQGVRELLSLLDKAREARGHIVGKGLARLADRLAPTGTRERAPEFTHSPDYRSVSLRGETHSLTERQAHVIQILHDAYTNGTPELGTASILERLETPSSRLRDTFKTNQPAWKALVALGKRKGTLRLNL